MLERSAERFEQHGQDPCEVSLNLLFERFPGVL
jgi:hypothetical protein